MQLLDLFESTETLNEVHWTDLYPKGFQDFRKKYLPMSRKKQTYGLYVQFSNHADNTMDRTAFASPDHHDPVGVYGYPMDYVLKHPADIWYGKGARFMRVLRDTSKSSLDLAYIDSLSKAERFLSQLGWTYGEREESISLAMKHYKSRLLGSTKFAKIFLMAMQIDFLSPPVEVGKASGKKTNTYRIRTGVEQTALLRKAGIDALVDTARTNKQAVINDREPEQIIFLTRAAFRVEELFSLRPGLRDDQTGAMNSSDPDRQPIVRPLAAAIAKAMGDQITEYAGDKSLWKKVKFDASYRYYWTRGGRRIKIEFERSASYYDGKKMGEKKHREAGLSDSYQTRVEVKTEFGDFARKFGSSETFTDIVDDFARNFAAMQREPHPTDWKPENARSFMDKQEAEKEDYWRKEREKEMLQRRKDWPDFVTNIQYVTEHFGMDFTPPTDDNAIDGLMQMIPRLANIYLRNRSDITVEETVEKWIEHVDDWFEVGTDVTATIRDTARLIGKIVLRASKDFNPQYWLRSQSMFSALKREIEDRLSGNV